jgi:hypothetical protein
MLHQMKEIQFGFGRAINRPSGRVGHAIVKAIVGMVGDDMDIGEVIFGDGGRILMGGWQILALASRCEIERPYWIH